MEALGQGSTLQTYTIDFLIKTRKIFSLLQKGALSGHYNYFSHLTRTIFHTGWYVQMATVTAYYFLVVILVCLFGLFNSAN